MGDDMKRSWLIREIVAWTVFFPVALVLAARRKLGYGFTTPEGRIAALLRWYPEAWRERHGDGLGEVLRDTIEDDRDGLRVSLDVAREGAIERMHAFDPHRAVAAALLTVGWIAVLPQGIVAAAFLAVDGPRSWFLAQYVESPSSWLVIAAMIAGGLVLIDRALYGFSRRPVANR
jgi:hypothetical protein